ncbi:hypothetical protein B0T22DRAFT_288484 [Podospora appendiculata]|uniref:Uncharacterized protein n=1 Tax=Podospora appendiculata TaxID=314037 RepID=A0AAE0X103_9PEZI|nr:hypothetical protein B0T22DRAFT_288484 [Podospora appendiculata]
MSRLSRASYRRQKQQLKASRVTEARLSTNSDTKQHSRALAIRSLEIQRPGELSTQPVDRVHKRGNRKGARGQQTAQGETHNLDRPESTRDTEGHQCSTEDYWTDESDDIKTPSHCSNDPADEHDVSLEAVHHPQCTIAHSVPSNGSYEDLRSKRQLLDEMELQKQKEAIEQYQKTGDTTLLRSLLAPFALGKGASELSPWKWNREVERWFREDHSSDAIVWAPTPNSLL